MTPTAVECRREGSIGWIRLEGADRLNPIGTTTYMKLAQAIRDFECSISVRAAIVHGAGRVFSAGADIGEIAGYPGRDEFTNFIDGFTDALNVVASSRLPVIAAIHGAALGGGLELALACDLRVCTGDAKLGLPEAKLGVLPGAGGTQRLPRLIPPTVAVEMLMLGTFISGERAYALGLVNRLSDAETLLETAERLALQLADGSAQVAQAVKSLLPNTIHMNINEAIRREHAVVADLFDSPDAREGFAAFLEKRPPSFNRK